METINFDVEKLKRFYQTTETILHHLALAAGLRDSDLGVYYEPRPQYNVNNDAVTINKIYLRFLLSLQNRSRTFSIITLHDKEDKYKPFFFDYNPKQVVVKYKSAKELYSAIKHLLTGNQNNSSMALQWCQGAIDGANELAKYDTPAKLKQEFNKHLDLELPLYWSKKITGMGFALSCDFFKEIGYEFPKPDIHIRNVFKEIFNVELKDINTDEELCAAFISAAEKLNQSEIKTTVYKFDRMIWLACTGKFFLHKNIPASLRERLIAQCNN